MSDTTIEIEVQEATVGLWGALSVERQRRIASLLEVTVTEHARLEASEMAEQLRELRSALSDAGKAPVHSGTATTSPARAQQAPARPTPPLPARGPRHETVEIDADAISRVVQRLGRCSKSRIAAEFGAATGTKGYRLVGELLERMAKPGEVGPLIEDGTVRGGGKAYRIRPGVKLPDVEGEPEPAGEPERPARTTAPADHRGVSPRHDPEEEQASREASEAREADAVREERSSQLRASAPLLPPTRALSSARAGVGSSSAPAPASDEALMANILVACRSKSLTVPQIAQAANAAPGRVAQLVQRLAARGELERVPPGMFKTMRAEAA